MYEIFDEFESIVKSYCKHFPAVFDRAKNSEIYSNNNERFIDFFAGAGALNYGHNNDYIKQYIISYLNDDRVTHALDMNTSAKYEFLVTFKREIIEKRNYDYKVMFCGSTGTNAVEAALKLVRNYQKNNHIFAFSGSFHGMTLGSLSITSNKDHRKNYNDLLNNVTFIPFQYGYKKSFDGLEYIENILEDDHSGIEKPAAVFLETVQAEGGVYVAEVNWIKKLAEICKNNQILLVVDDIQIGCGRTGNFFSFERAGIEPDIVVLSKSISGYGLPMSMILFKPSLDIWETAEHTGTFRGYQLAYVGATAAIKYWKEYNIKDKVLRRENLINDYLKKQIKTMDSRISIRGIGCIWGVDFSNIGIDISKKVQKKCFESGLIIETAGRHGSVIKILPPLNIEEELLINGLNILKNSIEAVTG